MDNKHTDTYKKSASKESQERQSYYDAKKKSEMEMEQYEAYREEQKAKSQKYDYNKIPKPDNENYNNQNIGESPSSHPSSNDKMSNGGSSNSKYGQYFQYKNQNGKPLSEAEKRGQSLDDAQADYEMKMNQQKPNHSEQKSEYADKTFDFFQKDENVKESSDNKQSKYSSKNQSNRYSRQSNQTEKENIRRVNGIDTATSGSAAGKGIGNFDEMVNSVSSGRRNPVIGRGARIASSEKMLLRQVGQYAVRSSTEGTELKRGAEYIGTGATIVAMSAVKRANRSCGNSMSISYDKKIKEYLKKAGINAPDWRIKNSKDADIVLRDINRILQKNNLSVLNGDSKHMIITINRMLYQNKNLSEEAKNALKAAKYIAKTNYMKSPNRNLKMMKRMAIMRSSMRYITQNELGKGAYFIANLARRSYMTLRAGLTLIRTGLRGAKWATKKALAGAAWAAAKLAKTGAGQAVVNSAVGQKVKKASTTVKGKTEKVQSGYRKTKGKYRDAKDKVSKFRRDPFGIRSLGKRAQNRMLKPKTKAGKVLTGPYRYIHKAKAAVGNVIASVASAISALFSFLLLFFLAILVICIVVWLVITLIMGGGGTYDITTNDDEIQIAALERIEDDYYAQQDELGNLYNNYDSVVISYHDIRDDNAYTDMDDLVEETTNAAEMMCMAQIYFDFDFEEAGKDEVLDYIDTLYDDSHQTTINVTEETIVTGVDENGENITDTLLHANVNVVTYYFNGIFTARASSSYGTLGEGSTEQQIWFYFRSAGFSEEATAGIMGNLWLESGGFNLTATSSDGYGSRGLAQWTGGRLTQLNSFAPDWETNLQGQLDFIVYEMNHGQMYGVSLEQYKTMNDIDAATETICWKYERPNAEYAHLDERKSAAHDFYNRYSLGDISNVRSSIVSAAYSQIGVPYVWGGTTANVGLDCSGLVQYCYATSGIGISRTTYSQIAQCRRISAAEAKPGDLLFNDSVSHVAIYVGNGQMIEAPHTGAKVRLVNVRSTMNNYYRFIGLD